MSLNGEIVGLDWFDSLLQDCRAIIVESEFVSRWALVEGYHELGTRILEENHNFDRSKIYGNQIAKKVAKAIGKSERTINYAIQFARKYPKLEALPEGKSISWTRIVNKYLPEEPYSPRPEPKTVCPNCGHEF